MEAIRDARVFVAGHREPLGRALVARLRQADAFDLLLRSPRQLDLRDGPEVEAFFATQKPDVVILAPEAPSARSGDAERLHDAVARICTVARTAERHGTRTLVNVVSDDVYPAEAPLPLRERALWNGPLGDAGRAATLAGLVAVELCHALGRASGAAFETAIVPPTFGPNMDFDAAGASPLALMLRRAHEARVRGEASVRLPLHAQARREYLFVDDAADGVAFVMREVSGSEPTNVASGVDLPLAEWAEGIADVVGFRGRFVFESDAAPPRRVLDGSRLAAHGWRPRTGLREALERTYAGYLERFAGRAPHRTGARPTRASRAPTGRM